MTSRKLLVDKVRASREGHEFHEAWTARKAMQLLWPDSKLVAIAIEGLSPPDQASASPETVAVADITLYYGLHPTFEHASRTSIVQFKYSVADSSADFRAGHARPTITKFANTYRDYENKYGTPAVQDGLDFVLITNRPIYKPLLQAIEAITKGLPCTGEIQKQALQFKTASGLDGNALAAFAAKCKIVGLSTNVSATKHELATLLVDWSATNDPIARARLGLLRQMVRDKAGHAGTGQNLITRTDILAALEIPDPEELLPCKPATIDVGDVVKREQLADAIAQVSGLSTPILIHATGGVGKTVFIDSLAAALQDNSEVVLFDCFGGGAYRSPHDARHLPKRGLIHIANTLAFRGLCDPILPDAPDDVSLLRTFRRRLAQCVDTIKREAPGRELMLLVDAIDNAALFARERNEPSFPVLLLESLHHDPIPGIKLIVSCRTERKPSGYQELELRPFTISETATYLRSRLTSVSQVEINVAQARSGGNPRVLDYLVKSGRGVFDQSETEKTVELDDLIQKRISDALTAALGCGHRQEHIDAFLAGLAVLPPPVPLDEYAGAHGMQLSEVESFAADLWPLLERTNQGLMFRDEPTETLVRNRYGSSEDALRRVAANLLARQDASVYAARALPALLLRLNDAERLFQLAFDERIPEKITSTVGKRNIRYARIKTAVLHAASNRDYNRLVQLLVELSTIAAVEDRGADYILAHPDLVVAAADVDAIRRLFETRTRWPGTRHARLAIATCLSGQYEEATRHARRADEWIHHFLRKQHQDKHDSAGPEPPDIAAIPLLLISEGRSQIAIRFLRMWRDWYAYEVCEHLFDYLRLATTTRPADAPKLTEFVNGITTIGPLAAALSFQDFPKPARKAFVVKLSRICNKTRKLDLPETLHRQRTFELQDGLRRASAIALSLGLANEALAISACTPRQRPAIWSLRDHFYNKDVFPFIFHTALVAAAKNRVLHEKDVLPRELVPICSRINKNLTGKQFRDKVNEKLRKHVSTERDRHAKQKGPRILSDGERQEADRFINQRLEPLLDLTQAFARFLAAPARRVDNAFTELLKVWEKARKNRSPYSVHELDNLFCWLGFDIALFALWARSELTPSPVQHFLTTLHAQGVSAHTLVRIVSVLSHRQALHALAGEQALKARTLIEEENDVSYRTSLLASLARAILPASVDEASAYFRDGLEQMDAIGSGDYEFTNELLLFASTVKGEELDERDFHTLTNICELSMPDEPEKFPWGAFATGLSKAAGPRGLAKLSRWDDRSKIRLENTLLSYLTALVDDGKIEPDLALALNRLADPVEYYQCGTAEFARAIETRSGTTRPDIIFELIRQFEDNNPGLPMETTVHLLASLAERTFGSSSHVTAYLSAAHRCFAQVRRISNDHMNYRGRADRAFHIPANDRDRSNRTTLRAIAASTNPTDHLSLAEAITAVNNLQNIWHLRGDFFAPLRSKVPFHARSQYVTDICTFEQLNLHWKLTELKECSDSWRESSAALRQVLKGVAIPLLRLHAEDLIDYGTLSRSKLREISDLTRVPVIDLILALIAVFANSENPVPGAVWLALASYICPEADDGQGQRALARLLRSDAARLADNVIDGPWANSLYPDEDPEAIAAGLVWRMLGSPFAEDRWRAAHSIRCLARFGRWNIVDALVSKLGEETAGPFQARELAFYYLHARLWLLIALARLALDYPDQMARYSAELLSIATEAQSPHVLMRHFAARALVACIDSGNLTMEESIVKQLRAADLSPHPRLNEKIRNRAGFYHGHPKSAPEPAFDFHLDYDFEKYKVDNLGQVFGKPCWEVKDMMSEIVHQLDPNASSMYEPGGRKLPHRYTSRGMTTAYHTYGQHLGWHALFLAAGTLLNSFPVTNDSWYDDDPWGEWLGRYVLTRDDGLWLSDGTDRTPLDTVQVLLEKAKDGLALTGDRKKLLQLVGLTSRVSKELVIEGFWHSADSVRVHISSVLVPPEEARRLARKLIREDPMIVGLPTYHEADTEFSYSRGVRKKYTPWIICPSGEARLDEHDPFGTPCANVRPRLAPDCASALSLTTNEPFGRYLQNGRGTRVLRAEAWGRGNCTSDQGPHPGLRLWCSSSSLRQVLKTHDKSLLLLIRLERYEKGGYREEGKYTHTVAVLSISKTPGLRHFRGCVNHLHKPRY